MRVPLFALMLFAAAPGLTVPTVVDVHLSNFVFTPNALTFEAGQDYQLHLINDGKTRHSFSAPAFFAGATVSPTDRGKVGDGTIELPPRGDVTVAFRAPAPGDYPLRCTHSLHSAMGMKGKIVVR